MGLEPIRHSTHAPQTCLSAYSSTLAVVYNPDYRYIISHKDRFVKTFFDFAKNSTKPERSAVGFFPEPQKKFG